MNVFLYIQLCLFLRDTYLLTTMRTMFVIRHMTLVYVIIIVRLPFTFGTDNMTCILRWIVEDNIYDNFDSTVCHIHMYDNLAKVLSNFTFSFFLFLFLIKYFFSFVTLYVRTKKVGETHFKPYSVKNLFHETIKLMQSCECEKTSTKNKEKKLI